MADKSNAWMDSMWDKIKTVLFKTCCSQHAVQNSWQWRRRTSRKHQPENLVIATQDQAPGTNNKKHLLNTQEH